MTLKCFNYCRFLAKSGKTIIATSSNQLPLLNQFLHCLNRTCLLIALVPLQDSALSLHWLIQGKQASQPANLLMKIARSGLRNLDFLFALLWPQLFLSLNQSRTRRPNEKSWPASVRAHSFSASRARSLTRSLCSSLALRRTSQLVAGGRLRREHVTLESSWKGGGV